MSNIFQIKAEHLELVNSIIDNGGEVTPEIEQALRISEAQLQGKAISYGQVIRSIESDLATIDNEMARLKGLKEARQKTIERLKNTVSDAMQECGIEKVESATLRLSFRKSESTEIDNPELVPKQFKTEVVTTKIDKTAIKAAIKAGETVQGARVVVNQNLQIR